MLFDNVFDNAIVADRAAIWLDGNDYVYYVKVSEEHYSLNSGLRLARSAFNRMMHQTNGNGIVLSVDNDTLHIALVRGYHKHADIPASWKFIYWLNED